MLATHRMPLGVRTLARLARVAPSTALRISREVVKRRWGGRVRLPGQREMYVLLRDDRRRELARSHRLPLGGANEQLAFLTTLDAPIWVLDRDDYAEYTIPKRIPTFVVMPRSWRGRVHVPAGVPTVFFEGARPLEFDRETLPEIERFIALLRLDPQAAKFMYQALDKSAVGRRRLTRRLRDEGLTSLAKRHRFVRA